MKFAFLYRVISPATNSSKYFVAISQHQGYAVYNSGWMDNPLLPSAPGDQLSAPYTLVPDMDIQESIQEFQTEVEAYNFMAKFYASQVLPGCPK